MSPSKGHVLIVDDDPSINRMFQLLLKDAGYRVSSTTTSEETLKYLKIILPDVMLLDISLPGMDGVELAHRIKNDPSLPFIPIIHITALSDMRTKVAALDAGSDDILIKPVEFAELLARVRVMMRLQQSRRSLQETTRRIQLLFDISQTLTTSLDINTVLRQIVVQLCDALDAVRASIILVDNQHQILLHASSTNDQLDNERIVRVLREGVAGWVMRSHRQLIIADARRDQRWTWLGRGLDPTRSVIAVPMLNNGQVLGVITAVHTRTDYFHDSHLELMQSVASQTVVAFDHAQLFQMTIQQKHQLERRSHMLAEMLNVGERMRLNLPLNEMLNEIAASIQRSLGFSKIVIHIFNQNGTETQGFAGANIADLKQRWTNAAINDVIVPLMNERSLISRSFRIPRQALFAGVEVHDETLNQGEHLVVPIGSVQQLQGIIVVDMPLGTSAPDLGTIQALEVFANQVATAVQNNQLFALEMHRGNQLQLLVDIGRNIAELMTPEQLLRLVASLIRHTFGFSAVHVILYEDQQWVIRGSAASYHGAKFHLDTTLQTSLLTKVLEKQQAHVAYNDGFIIDYSSYPKPIRAELTVSLADRNGVQGFVIAASEQTTPFESLTESLITAIAAQLVVALENAKLFAHEQDYVQQMSRINDLSVKLTAEQNVLNHIPDVLNDINVIFAAQRTALLLYDDHTGVAATLVPEQPLDQPLPEIKIERLRAEFANRQSVIINQESHDSQEHPALYAVLCALNMSMGVATTLQISTGLSGILIIEPAHQMQRWRLNDRTMLQTAANLLAQAIENSQLQQQRMQRLRADMSRYMAPQLVDQLLTEGGFGEAAERDVVVMFADLRGFTALSEHLEPRIVIEQVLNRFFDVMTDVLYAHDAVIDKFLGDGLMAVFGSVRPRPDDVERAIRAARAMQQAFRALQASWKKDFGLAIGLGIGLNWGPVVVGNIGSAQRLDYTVIGDVVNTASRLVSIAEGGQIILSQQLVAQLPASLRRSVKALPPVLLKGKSEEQAIYAITQGTRPLT